MAVLLLETYALINVSSDAAKVVHRTSVAGRAGAPPPRSRSHGPNATGSRRRVRRPRAGPAASQAGSGADCIYSANSISVLNAFDRLVNRTFGCVMVYSNSSPDWAGWEKPWFLTDSGSSYNWQAWATAPGTHRQLIITMNLFPSSENSSDWLHLGASGAYVQHAQALARNLVAAGLGHSVIRLAHEANDASYPYSLPTSDPDLALWRRFWRETAIAMRSVPGAHFLFDWCINAYWRPIPLNKWYPGDDVVNIVGIDAYDSGVPVGEDRWTRLYTQPDGIKAVLQFATAHGKPVSLPEWGLWPTGPTELGGGDDPSYVDRIATVVRTNRLAYQSYFYNLASRNLLHGSPLSLAAFRRHFGGSGDSVGAATVGPGT